MNGSIIFNTGSTPPEVTWEDVGQYLRHLTDGATVIAKAPFTRTCDFCMR